LSASEEIWDSYFRHVDEICLETDPSDVILPRDKMKAMIVSADSNPDGKKYRFLLFSDDKSSEATGFALVYVETPHSPTYKTNRHIARLRLSVSKKYRRKGLAVLLLKRVTEELAVKEPAVTEFLIRVILESGKHFMDHIGGTVCRENSQNRLYLAEVDWTMIEAWAEEGARKNPGGATLQEVVPVEMYARWRLLKADYIGGDRGIENWRPIFAAMELWDEAIDDSGLTQKGTVRAVISRIAKQHKLKQTRLSSILVVKDAKAALNEFRASKLDDLDCFGKTMLRLETDLIAMKARANAWAIGDIEALRGLPYTDQNAACERAAMQAGVVQKRMDRDLDAELERKWFDAAEKALANNTATFALLPMAELLKPDGYLAKLQAKGYVVQAPE